MSETGNPIQKQDATSTQAVAASNAPHESIKSSAAASVSIPGAGTPKAGISGTSASKVNVPKPRTPKPETSKDKPPRKHIPISFNSPVILGFTALSFVALLLGLITGGATNRLLFSTYRTFALDPLGVVRMFTYVLGHADFEHWISNITLMLIVGPMIEEKYGSLKTLLLILVTAFSTALFNNLLFSTGLLGASGVVFAMILLSSFASYEKGSIPLTLVLVAIIFIGGQVISALQPDGISQFAHIFGGIVGCAAGFAMNRGSAKKPRANTGVRG